MEWYPASTLITVIISAVIACFTMFRSRNHRATKVFSFLLLGTTLWCLGAFLVNISTQAKQALYWTRFMHLAIVFVPSFFIHFVIAMLSEENNWILKTCYGISIFFAFTILSPLLITKVTPADYIGWSFSTGILYYPLAAFYVLGSTYGFIKLYKSYNQTSTGYRKKQLQYFIFANLIAVTGIIIFYFLSISNLPFKVPPMDNLFLLTFILIVTYAMISYRLIDIRLAIIKFFFFSLFGTSVLILFIGLLTPVSYLVYQKIEYPFIVVAAGAFVLTVGISKPLREGLMGYVNQIVYGENHKHAKVIKDAASAVVTMLDIRELLGYVMETIVKDIGVKKVSLLIKEGSVYKVKASQGSQARNYLLKEDSPLIVKLSQNKDKAYIRYELERENNQTNKGVIQELDKIGAELIIPLAYKEELIGVLNLGLKSSGKIYSPTDIDTLTTLGTNLGIALVNAKLYAEAISDALTGLYHHKYFKSRLADELLQAKTLKYPFSVMMLDLDHFKKVNDTYGHPVGDEVLKEVADLMKENTRLFDVVARYGGEEFAIILPGVGKNGRKNHIQTVTKIAERLRKKIEEHQFSSSKIKLTISIGLAIYDGKGKNVTDKNLLKKADDELYMAKRQGRNRVCISSFSDLPGKLAVVSNNAAPKASAS
ncbi:MAG: diguanylate cyclase [Actinobacteria bacterium]|nr:MAG: diguanylate cyclase [Actinomycetota bacterium]